MPSLYFSQEEERTERLEVFTTAISDAIFHAFNGHTWMFPMIGAIIFLLYTEIDKFSETLIYVHYSAKVVIFIGITITKSLYFRSWALSSYTQIAFLDTQKTFIQLWFSAYLIVI